LLTFIITCHTYTILNLLREWKCHTYMTR